MNAAKNLILHLLGSPDLSRHLQTLHDLALYESGEALLGPEEKEALQEVNELRVRIERMTPEGRNYLKTLLPS